MRRKTGTWFLGSCLIGVMLFTGACGQLPDLDRPEEIQSEIVDKATEQNEVVSVSNDKYVYQTLDGATQKVYNEIYQCLINQEEKVEVDTTDTTILDKAYKAVCADYGNIFWASGYVYTQYTRGDTVVGMDFAPQYTKEESERQSIQQEIDDKVAEIMSGYSGDSSDYEKAKYVFEYLATNVDYEEGSAENQNIISAFLYGKTVCQGYASATQYLLNQFGIRSTIVTGTANGVSHAWNLVSLDGDYYFVDTTWGNSRYTDDDAQMKRFVNYNYFAVTSQEISRTHAANDYFVLPDCTAKEDNYYVREGKYFSLWDPDTVGSIYQKGYEEKVGAVSVKFETQELYQQMKQYLIDEQHIADYCTGITSLFYVEDMEQNILTFSFT